MVNKSWSELSHSCPIDISRIEIYAKQFESLLPSKIKKENIDKAKEMVLTARGCFDSMITSLIQILYDRDILKETEDKILFAWLTDNLGRFLKRMDDLEFDLMIKDDEVNGGSVGISKIASYINLLRTSADSLIYESLLKATNEWKNIKETEEIKKDKRTFLYILFQILHVTLSILGGLTREKTGLTKRGIVQSIPTTWQSLMSPAGQKIIREGYEKDTGIDLSEFEKDISSLSEEENIMGGDLDDD